jgi:hypothetical protein
MARRRDPNVSVNIDLEADASGARKAIERDLDKIEDAAKDTANEVEDAFRKLSPKLQTDDIKRALDLAGQLDGMVANFTVDTDLSEIQEAEKLARSLRQFQGRVDLDVEGKAELKEALNLAEKMDQLRTVKVQVQGKADLEQAEKIAAGLDGRNVDVKVDVDASDLADVDSKFAGAGAQAADAFSGGFDPNDVGSTIQDGILGAAAAAGPYAAAAAGIGAVFAESFAKGFSRGFAGTARADLLLQLQGDLSGPQMREVGEAGAEAYGEGFGESLESVKRTAALIEQELSDIDPDLDLSEVTRQAEALAAVFGIDVAEAITSVDKLVSQGLVTNAQDGFNLLFDLGQRTGLQFQEMLELTNEFSTAIKALGIEGAQGLGMIADMVEQGIFPQVDQAGEVFEELNETIIGGGAAEALEKINFNAAQMQETIAGGGPEAAAAVADIATRILELDSDAAQAEATMAIFGSNMGLLGDEAREAALQMFAAADGTREIGSGASDAADDLAAMQTEWDKLSKNIEEAGARGGNIFAELVNKIGEFDRAVTGTRGQTDLAALGFVQLEGVADSLSGALTEGGSSGRRFAEGTDAAAAAVDDLDAALERLTGQYDTDALMRRFQEDVERARTAAQGLTSDSYALGTGFDITTEAGRAAESAFEDMGRSLLDVAAAHRDGSATTAELAAKQREARQTLAEVAGQMKLTQAETQALIDKYGTVPGMTKTIANYETLTALQNRGQFVEALNGVPPSTTTTATFNAWNAIQNVQSYIGQLLSIPSSRSTTVTQTTVRRTVDPDRRALGGPVKAGEPYIVGEEGQELFVPREDGTIIPNGGSSGAPFAGGGGAPSGGGRMVLEIRSGGTALDELLVEVLRKAVRNRGGIDVVFG